MIRMMTVDQAADDVAQLTDAVCSSASPRLPDTGTRALTLCCERSQARPPVQRQQPESTHSVSGRCLEHRAYRMQRNLCIAPECAAQRQTAYIPGSCSPARKCRRPGAHRPRCP